MTTATGIISWQTQASAFGDTKIDMQIASTRLAAINNHRFPGQYYDAETGLHQNYFRDYEASLGRYVQRDPIGLDGGINTYVYVENKATKDSDVYGLARSTVDAFCERNPVACRDIIYPKRPPKKSPTKPRRDKGKWRCSAVACCNDNIPGNCPTDPKQWCKQGIWADKTKGSAIRVSEGIAKARLGCQAKHVVITCTGPKGETWQRGG